MKLVKCSKGHYYDGERYVSCPHCAGVESQNLSFRIPQSVNTGNQQLPVSDLELTQPLYEPVSQMPKSPSTNQSLTSQTPELPSAGQNPISHTGLSGTGQSSVPLSSQPIQTEPSALESAVSASTSYALPNETSKTVGFYDFGGDEPVVGWLVCVKGHHHGQSFQLKSGHNVIGRDLKMDVALTKDNSVSRSRQAIIMYDPKNSKFYIQQGESGFTYLDGEVVLTPTLMQSRAIVGIGAGEYLFVPLCGDDFSWDNYKERED